MKNISCIFFALLLLSCGGKKEVVVEESIRPVKYGKVITAGSQGEHRFSGQAQASEETKLSFRVGGTLRSMKVKVGDRVNRGQLIAVLDATDYSIQVDQARAQDKGSEANLKSAETQIKSAESQMLTTKSTYQRVERLYENNSVSLSEYEQAKAAYETAKSQHAAAKAQYAAAETQVTTAGKQVQSARNQVNYTRLTAPFSGVISEVMVENNELVNSGTPIAVISSEKEPEVTVGVPEIFIAKVKRGQQVKIIFSVLPDIEFDGEVAEIAYAAGASPTYPVIVRIKKPSQEIRPGMSAAIQFDFGTADKKEVKHLVVPVKAVGEGNEGNFVFVLEKSGDKYLAKKRSIKIGTLLPQGFKVTTGLKENELVATAGLKSLLDGMEVKLLE